MREEIKALIQLLDDPNTEVNQAVMQNLINRGPDVIPELEAAWEDSMDPDYQEKVVNLIQEIQFSSTSKMMDKWLRMGSSDLLKGAYILALFQYPDLKYKEVEKFLDKIIKDVWLELNSNLTALEKVRILNHIIFDVNGFSKNTTDFYSPRNSFINQVLESKKGNPISLAIIYSVVAQRLGLPIYGVNLPKNFILAYEDELTKKDILFYINPYNKGAVLGEKEIEYFLKQQEIEARPSYFLPCSNIEIIIRVLHNLVSAYHKSGYREKAEQFEAVLKNVTGSIPGSSGTT